jgi:hypothetical protein
VIGALLVVAQLSIVTHAPETAAACDAIEISVAVSAPGRVPPVIRPPSFSPFDILRSSPTPHVTYDARGQGTVTAEYQYVITTDHLGTYSIAPFEARLGSQVARSRLIQIAVRPMNSRSNVPTVVARARVDTGFDVKVHAPALPETVFVGQQANYEVAVFVNSVVRDRLRRNPTFFPPDMQSMLAYDLPSRSTPPRHEGGSNCYDALVYQRALFPLMPGRFAIPPAQLVYSLPLSSSFFSREETHELQTDSTIIVAVEPPLAGRPPEFGGAVGRMRVSAKLDTSVSRVGDPMLLTVKVSGTGNVKLFPRPSIGVPWASLVKGDERVDVDTTARRIGGSKEFDWVLTPKIAGELDLPPIRYGYFDPDAGRYEVAATPPARVRIEPGTLASADTARTETLLPLRTRDRGAIHAPLHEHPAFWALLALAPLPALTLRGRERRRTTPRQAAPRPVRLGSVVKDALRARDASQVRRAFTGALAERVGLNPESFTRAGGLARALRRRGVSSDVALDAERFLRELDEAAFSRNGELPPDAAERATRLFRQIDDESLTRAQLVRGATGLLSLVLFAVATAHAITAADARRAFDKGVVAYQAHNFVAARESFIAAAVAESRSPDAWANLGTAAWAAADTARSVAAWQRALRLEPLAGDMRERVELVHSLPWNASGWVPPIPATWVFDFAALLWYAAWAIAMLRLLSRRRVRGGRVTAIAAVAALLVVSGFAMSERLSGRDLAVMRRTTSLSTDPEIGGDRGATAIVGEVVRATGRQGAWTRVRLDDGREGWIESAALISLDARDAGQIAGD